VAEVIGRDRSPIWIGLADLLLCVLSVVIVAVAPKTPAQSGIDPKAEFLITMESSVDIDADPDIWLITPAKRAVFYQSRDVGCATLDSDNRGFIDSIITLPDGTKTKVDSDKETISLHCIEAGHYDIGVNLYAYRENGFGATRRDLALKCHVEVVAVHPVPHVMFSKEVVLNRVGETINAISFDMSRDGALTEASPPLESITKQFQAHTP
jgi:hypothetical protein